MDTSLDEILRRRQANGAPNALKTGGPMRNQRRKPTARPYRPKAMEADADEEVWGLANAGGLTKKGTSSNSGILSRLGHKVTAVGTKVLVGNLRFDVLEDQLMELFGTSTGYEIISASLRFDKSGRSTGIGEVVFARQSEALEAVKMFHARLLDGVPLQVKLAGKNDASHPDNPFGDNEDIPAVKSHDFAPTSKATFFGTALKRGRDPPMRFSDRGNNNNNGRRGGRGGGRGGDRAGGRGGGFKRGGRGSGAPKSQQSGGRGGGNKRGHVRGLANPQKQAAADNASPAQMDAQMDAYMNQE